MSTKPIHTDDCPLKHDWPITDKKYCAIRHTSLSIHSSGCYEVEETMTKPIHPTPDEFKKAFEAIELLILDTKPYQASDEDAAIYYEAETALTVIRTLYEHCQQLEAKLEKGDPIANQILQAACADGDRVIVELRQQLAVKEQEIDTLRKQLDERNKTNS